MFLALFARGVSPGSKRVARRRNDEILLEWNRAGAAPKEEVMKQSQAEANWIWNPKRGDLRPKEWPKNRRLRCTDRNIEAQQCLARPGTLIHTTRETDCPRKKAGTDEKIEQLIPTGEPRKSHYALKAGEIKYLAVASHIENVNCLWCRRDYF